MLTLSNSPVSTRHLHERQPLGSANRAAYGGSRISEACEVKEPGSPIHVGAHVVRSAAAGRANPVPSAMSSVRQWSSVRISSCVATHSGRSPAKALSSRRTSVGWREAGPPDKRRSRTPPGRLPPARAWCWSAERSRASPDQARRGRSHETLRIVHADEIAGAEFDRRVRQ